jgi:hypothetical protein
MREHMRLLGWRVEDRVTGFKGVVTSISFDLYGCVQAIVTPPPDKDGKLMEQHWFDVKRLFMRGAEPVMKVPQFESAPAVISAGDEAGPQAKPALPSQPIL